MKKQIIFLVMLFLAVSFLFTEAVYCQTGTAVSKDGIKISYSSYGKGDTALVFIHGWSCDQTAWKRQIPYFDKKYKVITLDLAGHGKSGKQRTIYTMELFGQDVAAVVNKIKASKIILLGHSMAGVVIIETAKIIPDKITALVGIDTMQNFEQEYTPEQVAEVVKPFKQNFKKTADSFIRNMFVKDSNPAFVDSIVHKMASADPKIAISAMEEMFKTSYIKNPPNIKTPVWCLNADLWPTNAEGNRKYVSEFNVHIMHGVGHFLMLEKPDEFNKQLDEIITEILNKTK